MLETLPDDLLENGTLKAFDIQYKVEGQWKDEVVSESQQLDGRRFLHKLKLTTDGKELAVGMSEWE